MAAYQCFFSRVDLSPTLQTIQCTQDGDAIDQATALLYDNPKHFSVEIWKDTLLFARIARSRSPRNVRDATSGWDSSSSAYPQGQRRTEPMIRARGWW